MLFRTYAIELRNKIYFNLQLFKTQVLNYCLSCLVLYPRCV